MPDHLIFFLRLGVLTTVCVHACVCLTQMSSFSNFKYNNPRLGVLTSVCVCVCV